MAFCTFCGGKLDDGSAFCEHCGAQQDAPMQPVAAAQTASSFAVSPDAFGAYADPCEDSGGAGLVKPAERVVLPRNIKIILAAVAAVIVLIGGFVLLMGQLFTPEKTSAKFLDAVRAKDFAAFSAVTVPAEPELDLSEEAVTPFFALCEEQTDLVSRFRDTLQTDAKALRFGVSAKGDGLLRLVKRDYFLFKTYQVEISGVSVDCSSPLPGTTVQLGTRTISLPESNVISTSENLLPGIYVLNASAIGALDGSEWSYELPVCTVWPYGDTTLYADFEYATLWLQQPAFPITALSINEVAYTGDVSFADGKAVLLFPLHVGDTVKVDFDVAGIKMSDDMVLQNAAENGFLPQPELPEANRKAALALAGDFIKSFFSACNAQDISALKTLKNTDNNFLDWYIAQLEYNAAYPDFRNEFTYTLTALEGDLAFHYGNSKDYDLYFTSSINAAFDYKMTSYGDDSDEPKDTEDSTKKSTFIVAFGCKPDGTWVLDSIQTAHSTTISQPISLL